jgi:hypothetical protein
MVRSGANPENSAVDTPADFPADFMAVEPTIAAGPKPRATDAATRATIASVDIAPRPAAIDAARAESAVLIDPTN